MSSAPKYNGLIVISVLFSVFTNLLMLTGPLFMLQIYDRVLAGRSEETLIALFLLVAFLFLLFWLLEFARARVMSRVGAQFQVRMNKQVFQRIIKRAAVGIGPRKGTLQDIDAIRSFFASPICLALMDIPWTPLFIAAIFVFHPLLGWLAVTGGAILVLAAILNQVLTFQMTRQSSSNLASAQNFAQKAESAGEYLWAQGMLSSLTARWELMQNAALSGQIGATDWTGAFSTFTKAFRLFLQSAMLALGAWLVLQGQLTAGAMIAASIVLGRALAPVEIGISQWQVAQRAWSAWRDLRELIRALPNQPATAGLPKPRAILSVDNLSIHRQQGEAPILSRISFALAPGEAIGVIGKSGAGKTTLARAIVGLVGPTAGDIRLDGATLDQYARDQLGSYIGYLPQDIQLFKGTIAENIAQMAINPDPVMVIAAAKKAAIHDIILKLPRGYNTRSESSETRFSGGEMQRLALARALFHNPVLLVLDEPNSALDADGSKALNTVIETMKAESKGVLIMTHRPTAISTCDKLLLLEEGKVASFGARDRVIKSTIKNAADVKRLVQAS